jgi:hypothetical protein
VLHGLQRAGHHDVVETAVAEVLQAVVDVGLDDVDAGGEAFGDVVRIDFEAVAANLARPGEVREQRTVAAAEVEDARAGLDPLGDERQVGAQAIRKAGHDPTSTAARPR